jgi:hypothetical protein
MGELPHGEPPAIMHGFPVYDLSLMRVYRTLHAAEHIGAQARRGTDLPQRILMIDPDIGIRHETKLFVNNTSMNHKQNQAGNAAPECQL